MSQCEMVRIYLKQHLPYIPSFLCHFCHFCHFSVFRSCFVLIKAIKSNLLCSFCSKYHSTLFPVHSGHSLSACQSSIDSIQVLVISIIPGTTCCAITSISISAPTVLSSSAIRSSNAYSMISCCFLVLGSLISLYIQY